MGNLAAKKIRMDSSVLDGRVAVLLPLKEEEFSDKDFALCESMIILSSLLTFKLFKIVSRFNRLLSKAYGRITI